MKKTPLDKYSELVNSGEVFPDSSQKETASHLNKLFLDLNRTSLHPSLEYLRRYFGVPIPRRYLKNIRGLYLCGGVGRGKTMLMDMFYSCLPEGMGQRYHFHRFMQRVHEELTKRRGTKNPIDSIAEQFAAETRVVCFDEFYVSDIADAMILSELLKGLFDRNVIFVATSNTQPKNLYPNGLQRAKFLPAIELLKKHTRLILLQEGKDFRLRTLTDARVYHFPISSDSERLMKESFDSLADNEVAEGGKIMVLGRAINAVRESAGLIWFEFSEICGGPRSQNDFIEISKIYQTVFVSAVPVLSELYDSATRRFISLVDEFYDRGVKLILEAEVEVASLYKGGQLEFEFRRTASRLLEMQSLEYLSREHH